MSTLKADTIQSTGGGAATLTKQEANKMWVNYTGSDASVNDSLNVSSTTDDDTGKDTVSFSNSMGNANYSATMGCSRNGATTADNQTEGFFAIATGSIKINTMRADNGAYTDFSVVTMQIAGDLA